MNPHISLGQSAPASDHPFGKMRNSLPSSDLIALNHFSTHCVLSHIHTLGHSHWIFTPKKNSSEKEICVI